MQSLILMIQFMTRYPIPVVVDFTAVHFVKGMKWMPLIGLLVALPAAGCYAGFEMLLGRDVATLAAVIILIWVTGGLHLDGIADTADGLFSYNTRERMLEIMRDSNLGAHGVTTMVLTVLSKFVLLRSVPAAGSVLAVLTVPVLGHMALTWHAAVARYARDENGIGDFVNQTGLIHASAATLLSVIIVSCLLLLWGFPLVTVCAVTVILHLATAGFAVLFAAYLTRRLGGITGDTIGATIELAELAGLFVFLFLWKYQLL
ncbi:MAG: adenosylcobinamide-GDP ribazoletransferase [Desulfobulbus sp.]|nr:adenosylcobinamide-GDP ribazoletransferase [Desulfobulbus sp.]